MVLFLMETYLCINTSNHFTIIVRQTTFFKKYIQINPKVFMPYKLQNILNYPYKKPYVFL